MRRNCAPWLVLFAALSACGADPRPEEPAVHLASGRPRTVGGLEARVRPHRPVLVVGLDGADWQHLEPLLGAGALPHLAELRAGAAWGTLETEVPALSPLLWTTLMTGVSPLEHGVLDFGCFRPGSGVREPIGSDERRVPAIWNVAAWGGLRADVLGLWATHPAEATGGVVVSDRFFGFLNAVGAAAPAGAVHPPERARWAGDALERVSRETDYAVLAGFVPGLTEAEYARHADSRRPYDHPVSALRRTLIETRLYGELALSLLVDEPPADLAIAYFQGTDTIGHVFAPYVPPRLPGVAAADFERYRGTAERYFREIDGWLGRLVAAARTRGATVVLVSDHGFLWGEGRPERLSSVANASAARWHRREGIWLVAGEGIAAGRGGSATLRQLYPTLLSLLGLPAAAGIEAEPLAGVAPPSAPPFEYAAVFREIRSRRTAEADGAGAAGDAEAEALAERAASEEIAELQALGYLGGGELARAPAAVRAEGSTRTAGSYNNAGILLRGEGRDAEARGAFERALELEPDLASAAWNLSELLWAAGESERADELLLRALAGGAPEGARALVARAIAHQRAGRVERSLALLDRGVEARPEETELWLFRGRYRVESGDCHGAATDFARATALSPRDAAAWASLGLAELCRGDRAAAESALRRSLGLDPEQPRVRALLAGGGGR